MTCRNSFRRHQNRVDILARDKSGVTDQRWVLLYVERWLKAPLDRRTRNGRGELFRSFTPAISDDAGKSIRRAIKRWRLHLWSGKTLTDLSRWCNATLRGWINYYGRFYVSALKASFRGIDGYLMRWTMRKYKGLKGRPTRAWRFVNSVAACDPGLFAHWRLIRPNRMRRAV